jgi:hypothetical protein
MPEESAAAGQVGGFPVAKEGGTLFFERMKNEKFRAFMLIFKVGLISIVLLAGGYVFVDVMTIAKPVPKKAATTTPDAAKPGAAVPAPTSAVPAQKIGVITPAPTPADPAPAKKNPTPFAAINQALAMPGQMVSQAKAVVAKSDERTGELDKVIVEAEKPELVYGGAEGGAAKGRTNSKAIEAALGDMSKTAEVAPVEKTDEELAANNPLIIATPDASAAFRAWVGKSQITSVVNGNPPTIMINNVLVRGGQEANAKLGIIFDSIDTANKKIVFRDKSGAMVLLTR